MLDLSDIIIPYGWTVISHGTSFDKWRAPLSTSFPAQDLRTNNRIVVCDTVNGGLACTDDENFKLSSFYAGQ